MIPKLITDGMNYSLIKILDEDDIWKAIKYFNQKTATKFDGFNGFFYVSCWQIIKEDLIQAVKDFSLGVELPKSWSLTQFCLIPKVTRPTYCKDYRPISICNFSYKVITNIIKSRLNLILPSIISKNQLGYVPGRNIQDNILLAQKIMHFIDRKNSGGNIITKLDMA